MTSIDYCVAEVLRLKPGWSVNIDEKMLADIPSFEHNGATFTAADQVLERVPGSCYGYEYRYDEHTRSVVFHRLERPRELHEPQSYVSPDRRANI